MGYKVTLDVGSRYTGCKDLISGSVYLDNKGHKILFVGFGELSSIGYGHFQNCFIYLKVDEIEKKIKNGIISEDLKDYYGDDGFACRLFYISKSPRPLKSFLREMFPSDHFESFTVTQHWNDGCKNLTNISIRPVVIPRVCTVQYM